MRLRLCTICNTLSNEKGGNVVKKFAMTMVVCAMTLSGCGNASNTPKEEVLPIQVTLNGTTTTKEDKWDELEEGKELLLVDVTLQNNSEDVYEFNPNYIYIEVENSMEYSSFASPSEGERLGSCHLDPGESVSGIIPFEIDEGTTDYEIYFDDLDSHFEVK